MNTGIKKILSKGLSGGFGSHKYGKTIREGFALDSSDYFGPEGRYHDEWAAVQNGGGQELAEMAGGEKATKVYAGRPLAPELLQKIGLTEDDISVHYTRRVK